ncbi:MAG TPA: TolC family protein [Leptospiraceae bacterium]|jgi:outer membrane protein TolC|nr:TolC family protein [Leptospirales bacterium]HMX57172.1 TolC family protein [Leptospiraceae bacterium]HMY45641.1 TolC family protein [Leptospiraceae bacterium]HMZ35881.1 TolC family protein [Leptospiraceae bacterium]HNN76353.1 TolC family protein [Leptospiraceae bacterium]
MKTIRCRFILVSIILLPLLLGVLPVTGNAPECLTLNEAMALAQEKSPDMRKARAALLLARGEFVQKDRLIAANPEISVSGTRGTRATSPDVSVSPSAALKGEQPVDVSPSILSGPQQQRINGYEVELSQELDLAGKSSIQKKIARVEIEKADAQLLLTRLQVRAEVRTQLTTFLMSEALAADLERQLEHLRLIKQRMGPGFTDQRLGTYVGVVFQNDLARADIELRNLLLTRTNAKQTLDQMLGVTTVKVCTLPPTSSRITNPTLPEESELIAGAHANSPRLRLVSLNSQQSELGSNLADIAMIPDPTFFLGAGEQSIGSSKLAPSIAGPSSEREKTFRFGVRIPIPVFDRKQGSADIARAHRESTGADREAAERNLESSIAVLRNRYIALMEIVKQLAKLQQPFASLESLDGPFLSGRIPYSDWSEQYRRVAEIKKQYLDTRAEAARVLGEIEIIIGREIQ